MRKLSVITRKPGLALAAFTILILAAVAFADDDSSLKVVPFTFDPFDTDLVASRWVNGAGCPTGATINTTGAPPSTTFTDAACPSGDPKDRENAGLLLVKTGPTPNIAAAGAQIKHVKGMILTELGYDIRTGSHCGGGAPRFNVVLMSDPPGTVHFVGCNSGTPSTSSDGWTRLQWSAAALASTTPQTAFPTPIPTGSTVKSITIIFDEGQDLGATCLENAGKSCVSAGSAIIDNIDINGTLVGRGPGEKEGSEKHEN